MKKVIVSAQVMLNAIEMQPPIVFFDGVCNLCNRFIDWLVIHDSRAVFKIAPLQGKTAKIWVSESEISGLRSIVLFEGGKSYAKSTAVLKIASKLGAPWRYLELLLIIPLPIRDFLYDLVAHSRYSLFGKRETCRLPTPEETSRFLD